MHLRILLPAMLLAEIHQESLKDAVHPELILREIHKLQSSILILTRKRRIPNQPADIQCQRINPMMVMPRKMPKMTPKMIPQKPLQQSPGNTNLPNMRKSCQSLSQLPSDILINSLYPHQPLQGRKDNPVDDHILRQFIHLADSSAIQMLTALQGLSKIQLATNTLHLLLLKPILSYKPSAQQPVANMNQNH